jgi:uncharacterized membrane protein (UPF0127 family)
MGNALLVAENETQGLVLVRRLRRVDSFLSRLRGLMFRRRLGEDEGLLLVGRTESRAEATIHMLFVFFPIGVLWLDRENQVVDKTVARPFRPAYAPQAPAIGVLECQPAVLDRVDVGDTVGFIACEDVDEA